MVRVLPLRELRQNPTSAIDALEEGEVVVITRRNKPIADLVPHTAREGASPREFVAVLERTRVDDEWADDLARQRAEESRDVWGEER
ncbi:type II toxin-antitoxin system Phd/YefM family antitoxin [Microbacterium sp.]|uniref:type II toxin-antitoxin system Phd/YefM family antitoxin n=1 Tax=Microbacterium sp. TaxID=51671 RepID=UPI003C722CFB